MELRDLVHRYLTCPFPIWDLELTQALVENRFHALKANGILCPDDYSTASSYHQKKLAIGIRSPLSQSGNEKVYLEAADHERLSAFYENHGLVVIEEKGLDGIEASQKLNEALAILDLVPRLLPCVTSLVRSIQVLQQDDPQIDLSYSHPKIPFSIFVSVCEDHSTISNLRVAESILHEAMHLKLTLIEEVVQLVRENAVGKFYSPWKHENRNARGILHGIYVFGAIRGFYDRLQLGRFPAQDGKYIGNRQKIISEELSSLTEFRDNNDLTMDGVALIASLLPLSCS